jgi:hypothetical protein
MEMEAPLPVELTNFLEALCPEGARLGRIIE